MMDYTPQKRCIQCGQEFPLTRDFFHINRANKDGFKSRCKPCESAHTGHVHTPREKLPEGIKRCTRCKELKPGTREFFTAHPNMRDGLQSTCKACRAAIVSAEQMRNRSKRNAYVRHHYAENNDVGRATSRRKSHKRRAAEFNLPATLTEREWQVCLRYWNSCCAYCGNPPGLLREFQITRDHWIPVTDLRPDNPGYVETNIVPACRTCNNSKNNREPIEWLRWKFGTRKAKQIALRILAYFASLSVQSSEHIVEDVGGT